MSPLRVGSRRGQYGVIMALCLVPTIGVGALALDLAMVSSVTSQADAVAYAAAHTAIVAHQEGRSRADAEVLAANVVAAHPSLYDGRQFALDEVRWGFVDKTTGELVEDPNAQAAEALVSRTGGDSVGLLLAGVLGFRDVAVGGGAVSDREVSLFDNDGCDIPISVTGSDGFISRGNFDKTLSYTIENTGPGAWFELFKGNVSESGSNQLNESAYFRVYNAARPMGLPREGLGNCNDEYVVQDYDNDIGKLPDRIYIGTFYLEPGENTLEMRHYCDGLHEVCPEFEDYEEECGDSPDSVHFFTGEALCGELD